MTNVLCIAATAASSYAMNNPSHLSKRGSSGRLSARMCAALSPVSGVPHSSSSGTVSTCFTVSAV